MTGTNGGYRAVAIDLDGTLLRSDGTVSARTAAAVAAVQARGVRVMVATGRSVAPTVALLEGMPIETPVCCYNGAVIHDPATGDWLRHATLPETVSRAVLDALAADGLDCFVYRDDRKLAPPGSAPDFDRFLALLEDVERVERDALPTAGLTRISIHGTEPAVRRRADSIRDAHAGDVYLERFPLGIVPAFRGFDGHFCDVQPACAGKGEALRFLEETYAIPPSAVIAIGDQINDRPMLARAGLAVAVANAQPEIRAIAHRTIGHHDDDAVAAFLEETFL